MDENFYDHVSDYCVTYFALFPRTMIVRGTTANDAMFSLHIWYEILPIFLISYGI